MLRAMRSWLIIFSLVGWATAAGASPGDDAPPADQPPPVDTPQPAKPAADDAPTYGSTTDPADDDVEVLEVRSMRHRGSVGETRPIEVIDRGTLDRRQPQSTPEALIWSPGVYVQQTAHGQGSPYIRGRTGQQTLILFDGLRLNHALFRKGPNQYLFTVDASTLQTIEIVRGSASVELGSDAIAGAVLLHPLEPRLDPTRDAFVLRPRVFGRHRTADGEWMGRLELDAQIGDRVGVIVGVGGRTVGRLEAGGQAFPDGNPQNRQCVDILSIPCFEPDGRTQLGTGFDELTADARVAAEVGEGYITAAAYLYRQYDAPRTDRCPPPEQATGECLTYEEQFRTLVYGKVEQFIEWPLLDELVAVLGYQRQHQRASLLRPDRIAGDDIDTTTENLGRDAVDGVSGRVEGQTMRYGRRSGPGVSMRYGLDASYEWIESAKWIRFAQPPLVRALSRGQYVDGATYGQAGVFVAPSVDWGPLQARTGLRVGYFEAASPGDPESASARFDRSFTPIVLNAGLEYGRGWSALINVEQGFRAPNLDDLTARQSTGQGYQLENPDLAPERALTLEGGVRARTRRLTGELLGFYQTLDDAIERRLLTAADCRLDDDFVDRECQANRAPLALVNLDGEAVIMGLEARLEWRPIGGLKLRGTFSWAFGEGDDPGRDDDRRIPLSRIPPINGSGVAEWVHRDTGIYLGGGLRWALEQDRLSPGDVADARIPVGGTPGYVTADLWGGVELGRRLSAGVKLVNLGDTRYRIHGSSIFGAGRSVVFSLSAAPAPEGGWSW